MITRTSKDGFTLIELLVVLAIVSVLSSVLLSAVNGTRIKARNAVRMTDLSNIQQALELYYHDNGSYPISGGWTGTCSAFGSKSTSGATGWIPNLAPTYMPILPVDPKVQSTTVACYLYYSTDGKDYKLLAHQTYEGSCPPSLTSTHRMYDPIRSPGQCTIGIYTPGAAAY
jgi:prepilin-type N-terminal cleavage/methylation domain-containing protein